jgi:hypothetical protein
LALFIVFPVLGISQKRCFTQDLSTNSHIGTAELKVQKNLSDTAVAVLQLAKTLPYKDHEFSLFNNNLFNKPKLFRQLRALRIGACGTCHKDVTKPVFGNSLEM